MAFPAPVWKHGEGHVGKESACALRAPSPGGGASAARVRAAGCLGGGRGPGIPEAIQAERACRCRCRCRRRSGRGASGRTKLACLRDEPPGAGRLDSPDGNARSGERGGGRLGWAARGGAMSSEEGPGRLQRAGWAWSFRPSRCSAATWDWAGGRTKKSRSGVSERHRRRSGWFCDGRIRSRLCSRSAPWWSLRSRRPGCLRPPPPVARRPCWRFRRRCCWRRGPI